MATVRTLRLLVASIIAALIVVAALLAQNHTGVTAPQAMAAHGGPANSAFNSSPEIEGSISRPSEDATTSANSATGRWEMTASQASTALHPGQTSSAYGQPGGWNAYHDSLPDGGRPGEVQGSTGSSMAGNHGAGLASSDEFAMQGQTAGPLQGAAAALPANAQRSQPAVTVSQNLPPMPTSNAAPGGNPPEVPLAFIQAPSGDNPDQTEIDALQAMQEQFAQEMGDGPPLDPSSPQYAARWNKLQADIDSQYLAQFGFTQFNVYKNLADQLAFEQSP